jgi:hypothetical protein
MILVDPSKHCHEPACCMSCSLQIPTHPLTPPVTKDGDRTCGARHEGER